MACTPPVAAASRSIVTPARRVPHRPVVHHPGTRATHRPVVRRTIRAAGKLEDTSDNSPRSPTEEGAPTVTGPFQCDLSLLTPDERAWLHDRDELRVLVLGKTGVGKSSLVNAIANADSRIGALEVGTTQVQSIENTIVNSAVNSDESHDIALFDTPGFFDVEGRTPAGVLRELSGKVDDYHAVVYAHVATDRRLRLEDEQSVSFIVQALGPAMARRTVIALTFANEVNEGSDGRSKEQVVDVRASQVVCLFANAAERVAGDAAMRRASARRSSARAGSSLFPRASTPRTRPVAFDTPANAETATYADGSPRKPHGGRKTDVDPATGSWRSPRGKTLNWKPHEMRDGEGEWFDLRELDQGVVRDTTDGKSWLQPVNRGDQPPSRAGKRYDAEWEGDGWYESSPPREPSGVTESSSSGESSGTDVTP